MCTSVWHGILASGRRAVIHVVTVQAVTFLTRMLNVSNVFNVSQREPAHWQVQGGQCQWGHPRPSKRPTNIFCFSKTDIKSTDSSACDNAKRRSASKGLRPWPPDPLTSDSASGPRCGPRYRFTLPAHHVAFQTLGLDPPLTLCMSMVIRHRLLTPRT